MCELNLMVHYDTVVHTVLCRAMRLHPFSRPRHSTVLRHSAARFSTSFCCQKRHINRAKRFRKMFRFREDICEKCLPGQSLVSVRGRPSCLCSSLRKTAIYRTVMPVRFLVEWSKTALCLSQKHPSAYYTVLVHTYVTISFCVLNNK